MAGVLAFFSSGIMPSNGAPGLPTFLTSVKEGTTESSIEYLIS